MPQTLDCSITVHVDYYNMPGLAYHNMPGLAYYNVPGLAWHSMGGGLLFTPVECCLWIFNTSGAAPGGGVIVLRGGYCLHLGVALFPFVVSLTFRSLET